MRLSIRLRLTLVFACAMTIVLAAVGAFLYLRLESGLDEAINDGLRSRASDISALVSDGTGRLDSAPAGVRAGDESFTQLLDGSGNIADTTRGLENTPALTREQIEVAMRGEVLIDSDPLLELSDDRMRLLATPAQQGTGQLVVVVVGTSLDERNEALSSLLTQLLIIGPIALLLSSVLGYTLAVAALRPVDAMRRRAATISAEEPGQRLPVTGPRDEVALLGETLNDMLARLESAIKRERRFVADASHELRTPLALLKTELELAQRSARTREDLEAAIRSAADETDRLAQLAEDLLLLARADDGALVLRETSLSSQALLKRVAQRFGGRARAHGRLIAVDGTRDIAIVGDELRLEQALGNLIDNALRHGAGTITLAARVSGGQIELHVSDEGHGFPERFIAIAFERFSQAGDARTEGGAGLGLAIVDVIARAHGGIAQISDETGRTDVWLGLPHQ